MDRRGSKQTLAAAMCKIAGVLVKTLKLSAGVQQETLLLVAADVNVSRSRWLRHMVNETSVSRISSSDTVCTDFDFVACILAF